ncbi:MAG TPA: hypothetical protein VE244_00450 [Nitrososphaeraceae archaeon]|nr:hypothetical protein [Nitrososphaeraceae archaeon]
MRETKRLKVCLDGGITTTVWIYGLAAINTQDHYEFTHSSCILSKSP